MATLGETLKHEREVRGVTLQEIARATRINEKYLRAIEDDDFDVFHAPVFIMGFLRSYAGHLGLNSDEIISKFESLKIERKEEHIPTEPIELGDNNFIIIATVAILSAAIGGYVIYSFMSPKADEPAAVKPAVEKVAKPETAEEIPAPEKQPKKQADTEARAPAEKLKAEKPQKEETTTEPPVELANEVKEEIKQDQKPKLKPQPGAQSLAERKTKPQKAETAPARAEKIEPEKPSATRKKQTWLVYKYNLVVRAGGEDAWILVVIDDEIVKDMFVRTGQSITLRGNKGFNFSTGNAEHITLTLNGVGIPVEVPPNNVIRNWRLPIPGNE